MAHQLEVLNHLSDPRSHNKNVQGRRKLPGIRMDFAVDNQIVYRKPPHEMARHHPDKNSSLHFRNAKRQFVTPSVGFSEGKISTFAKKPPPPPPQLFHHHAKVNRSVRRSPLKKLEKSVRADRGMRFRDDSNTVAESEYPVDTLDDRDHSTSRGDFEAESRSHNRGNSLRRLGGHKIEETPEANVKTERLVPILGLFDLTARPDQHLGGASELAAARLALKHINEKGVIPGHRLVMFHNDTQCDSGIGVDAFFHAIYTLSARIVILLGAACPEVTESLAAVVPYWNIVQVSFGSVSPALSDRSSFPRFIRTVAPDSSHNAARLAFLTHYSWSTVATISENHDMYTLALNELMPALEAANISLQATVTLSHEDYTEHLHTLKEKDCRIIIASFSADLARKVFCQAYHLGMYGADYAWVLSGAPQDSWWQVTQGTSCSRQQLVEATQGAFLVANHGSIIGENASESGLTNSQFLQEFSHTGQPLTEYVTQTYDAVWTIALALRQLMETSVSGHPTTRSASHRRHTLRSAVRREVNSALASKVTKPSRSHGNDLQQCNGGHHQSGNATQKPTMSWILGRLEKLRKKQVLPQSEQLQEQQQQQSLQQPSESPHRPGEFSLTSFDYSRDDMADKILETMQRLRFRGVSGPISFDCPDRVGVTAFYQIQDGKPMKVALYHPEEAALDLTCPGCHVVVWPGGEVPASRVFKIRVETISPAAFFIMSALASLGILMALAFLIFNLTYRRLKYIKLSSPRLNNTTVVGCILVYTAVILLGFDHATLPSPHYFPVICTARAYLLSAGFSLAFGSMFTKTYRVHQIFTRSNSAGVIRNKLLKDKQLITLIMVLLAVDVMIVSAWVGVDPMTRHLHNLTLERSMEERGVVYQPQVEVCRSAHTSEWLGAFYVYKGLLVAVGVYMAWETRHVKIPALNDSQYIGMSVYNVVITSAIVIVAANIISERTTLAYVIVTTLIITSTTTTLCLLFIPKILTIWKKAEGDPIVESMGLKIQSNTRRLMTEDKREKFYRAEIQNKVYRRELLKLEQEIQKIKRRLESPDSPTSSAESFPILNKDSMISGTSQSDNAKEGPTNGVADRRDVQNQGGGGGGGSERINKAFSGSNIVGGRSLEGVLDVSHTQFLRSDDATVRRVKRERMMRSLHRSLPSLTLGCPSRRPSDSRLPADGAEDASGNSNFGPSQVFFDAHHFHEDQEEARRRAEDDDEDDDDEDSESDKKRPSSRYGTVPASPHPLQRCRLVKRSPIKPRVEPEDEGIVDLRYTLNFSTPLLHGVTEADLPFSISSHMRHGSRVSFRDQDSYHFYDSSPEIRKSSLSNCSYSSPEVRRSSMTSCSSTDIRLQIEYSDIMPHEKLSPVVEYRVNDLDLLCPLGSVPHPRGSDRDAGQFQYPSTLPRGADNAVGLEGVARRSSNGAISRQPLAGEANHSAIPGHRKSSKRKRKKSNENNSSLPNAARSSGHMFSTVIVHHVVNVHI
ncbi:LOW QUALITY PROTEIN: gamma-aminobutyric acid type B receptor subunit 2 [Macrobrachium rosenbergii]|uniref:LOW QUALITY PROTEIN: gamma-aminobutyric acid type B receptor subunit 2 n=1 Tax=Macrobrachium rosenbergii TaxID=79674 RepID=UPI0034D7A5B3